MARSISHRSGGQDGQDTNGGLKLPQGVSRFVFTSSPIKEDKPRRQVKYRMECQRADCGACKTIDRISNLLPFLRKHLACSLAWQRLAQASQESDKEYEGRLKELFSFVLLPGEGAEALSSKPAADPPVKRLATQSAGAERPYKKARPGKSTIRQYFGSQASKSTGTAGHRSGQAISNMPLSVPQGSTQQTSKVAADAQVGGSKPAMTPAQPASPGAVSI